MLSPEQPVQPPLQIECRIYTTNGRKNEKNVGVDLMGSLHEFEHFGACFVKGEIVLSKNEITGGNFLKNHMHFSMLL